MKSSKGFERSVQTLRAVKDYGWTYPSNYLDIYFEKLCAQEHIALMQVGEHCVSSNGFISMPAFGVFVDVCLTNAARVSLGQKASVATISMRVGIKKLPKSGRIKGVAKRKSNIELSSNESVMTEVDLYDESGDFLANASALIGMAHYRNELDIETLPQISRIYSPLSDCLISEGQENPVILEEAKRAEGFESDESFLDIFWGEDELLANDSHRLSHFRKNPHLTNRAGNIHGGILYGLSASAAKKVLSDDWLLAESSVQFLNAASEEGFYIKVDTLKSGRNTAVLACKIISDTGKEVVSSQWTFLKAKPF